MSEKRVPKKPSLPSVLLSIVGALGLFFLGIGLWLLIASRSSLKIEATFDPMAAVELGVVLCFLFLMQHYLQRAMGRQKTYLGLALEETKAARAELDKIFDSYCDLCANYSAPGLYRLNARIKRLSQRLSTTQRIVDARTDVDFSLVFTRYVEFKRACTEEFPVVTDLGQFKAMSRCGSLDDLLSRVALDLANN